MCTEELGIDKDAGGFFFHDLWIKVYSWVRTQGGMLAMQMSQLVFMTDLISSFPSQGKAKYYYRCDNTFFPNWPRFAQHKHSSCFQEGRNEKKNKTIKRFCDGKKLDLYSDCTSEFLWLPLKFPLEDRGCWCSRVSEADSNSEQIPQVIFPESDVWLIQILIRFNGNMQAVFATLKNTFYFFSVL